MKKLIEEIVISDEEFNLLLDIEKLGFVMMIIDSSKIDEKYFNKRNHNGTLELAYNLYEKGLINDIENAWHTTYELTDKGRKMIEQNK